MKVICSIVIFICSISFSTANDSLVYYSELRFNSALEKQAFEDFYFNNSDNYLSLFYAIEPNATEEKLKEAKARFNEIIGEFNTQKLSKKTPTKKIEYFYSKVHNELLEKYQVNNHFNQIFEEGIYNCVSATALYSLIFREFGIPFSIRETPTHVYLIGYPESEKILVETTNPTGGFNMYSDVYKKEFVRNLNSSKLISDAEYEQSNYRDLFDKYFFNDNDISLAQLVGIQYSNDAIYKMDNNDTEGAYYQLEKGYILNPNQNLARMLLLTGIQILDESRKSNYALRIKMMAKLSRFDQFGLSTEFIEGEFVNLTNELLVEKGNDTEYEKLYRDLISYLNDRELINSLSVYYNNERARLKYYEGNYVEALEYYKDSYLSNPDNLNTRNLMVNCAIQIISGMNNTEEAVKFLVDLQNQFENLSIHTQFQSVLGSAFLDLFSNYFKFDQPEKALVYKAKFEELYRKGENLNISTSAIAEAYSDAAVYFFKRNNKRKAQFYIDEGLRIIPGNFELLQRKRMLE